MPKLYYHNKHHRDAIAYIGAPKNKLESVAYEPPEEPLGLRLNMRKVPIPIESRFELLDFSPDGEYFPRRRPSHRIKQPPEIVPRFAFMDFG